MTSQGQILVADDNALVRRSVIAMLSEEADLHVCGEAATGPETIQKARDLNPDLVLLDVQMPGSNGLQTAGVLHQEFPNLKIMVMSQHDASHLLPQVLAVGGNGCVDKSRMADDLCPSIRQILENCTSRKA
jgi:DNA-binding NarL/FixJ family response regulator